VSGDQIVQIVTLVLAVVGGAFGRDVLKWFRDRDKTQADLSVTATQRVFADNEQARIWLRGQLDESEKDLKSVREHERELMVQVADLATQGARNEERLNAQAVQIEKLEAMFAKLGTDYAEMKAERDAYRNAKHDADGRLAPALARNQLLAILLERHGVEVPSELRPPTESRP
jgi:septal ring factor EnvC (AmiA/AmiB activator)